MHLLIGKRHMRFGANLTHPERHFRKHFKRKTEMSKEEILLIDIIITMVRLRLGMRMKRKSHS